MGIFSLGFARSSCPTPPPQKKKNKNKNILPSYGSVKYDTNLLIELQPNSQNHRSACSINCVVKFL